MAERQGKPKCFVFRHEGSDNRLMSAMMWQWVRRRQLALPLVGQTKSSASQQKTAGKAPRSLTTARGATCGKRIQDQIQSRLYYHLSPVSSSSESVDECGAVFNLEFSPLGDTLVTAYEGEAMQLFDPISAKRITKIPNAHTDCVNCIRFLDSRTFASGSDDKTVVLWDMRHLKRKICTLRGHRNWVKSIEYCHQSGLLITSAFDGDVLAWDINRYQDKMQCTKLFHMDTLMRTRLTPDSSKLIMSTSEGFYLMIHDLDLSSLSADFDGLDVCNLLWDESKKDFGNNYNSHVFRRSRNRAEIIMDFPEAGLAECISSLVIHPQGWCMVSRYTTALEDREWTCVHDLQDSSKCQEDTWQNDLPSRPPRERLMYYASEPNDGKGYIKELSISPDGRIICSSFSHGVRLLAFDTHCSELCDIHELGAPTGAQELKQVKLVSCHRATVLTSRFSPTQCLLASGCLKGSVVFHHPEL